MDCAQCGLELPRPAGDVYGDEIACTDCKAKKADKKAAASDGVLVCIKGCG